MTYRIKALLFCGVSTFASLVNPGAQAQVSAGQPDAGVGEPVADIAPDIVVTAQKKSESLQRVPAAVSVVDARRLINSGVTNLDQIGNVAPGVSVVPVRTQAFIFIRGVGQTLTTPNADAAVATNLNGVYLPAEIAGTAFFDVERIELLPGPQGTLYGRNSTGGVVNISSRKPGSNFGADGFVEVGNYDRRQAVLGIDVPITANLSSRTAGTIIRHSGYINNGEDNQRTAAIRQTVAWQPGSRTSVTGIVTYTHDGGYGSLFQNIPPQCGYRCATFDPKAQGYHNDVDTTQASVQVDQKLGDAFSLTYIGGYNHLKIDYFNSLFVGPTLAPLRINETIEIQSHEARLTYDGGDLSGILGLYYFDQDTFYQNDITPVPGGRRVNPFDAGSHGSAGFVQGTYNVASTFRVTGGLRYSNTVKSIDGYNSAVSPAGVVTSRTPFAGRSTMNRIDWKVGAELDLGPQSILYANVSTGFTPGGFSTGQQVLGLPAAAPFKPVTLRAYVAGTKNRLADGAITLNLEGFYYDYKNYQVSARDLLSGQNLVYNAAKATIYGAQFDSRFKLSRNDDFTFSATYLHAVADRLTTPAGRFDGYELPYSPKWTFNTYYLRSFDLANGGQLRADINFKYTSRRWSIYTHVPGFEIGSNTHTDMTAGYFAASDRWSAKLFVRNLEDKLVKTTCGAVLPGPAGCLFEAPRTYGVSVGFKI